jgi:hypothetical protein
VPSPQSVREFVFTVGGLGLLSAAAWTVALPAGLAAAGASLLVLDWLTRPDPARR